MGMRGGACVAFVLLPFDALERVSPRAFMQELRSPSFRAPSMRSAFLVPVLFAAVAAALPASAQTLQGRAVDRETLQPLPDASVALVDTTGDVVASARSGPDGAFRLTAPRPGEYRLTAARIGYGTLLSAPVPLGEGQVVETEARVRPVALALDSVRVPVAAEAGITGQVMEAASGQPIVGARVALLDSRGLVVRSVESDAAGNFHLRVERPGAHRLRADRVGYRRSTSPPVTVVPDDTLRVEMRMSSEALVLEPLTVVASSRRLMRDRQLAEFEWRRAHSGWGRFLGPQEIRRINPFHASDVLQQVPHVRVQGGGLTRMVTLPHRRRGSCLPTVYVDGHYRRVDGDFPLDNMVAGTTIAAVEVYQNPWAAPAQYGPLVDLDCGVIVLWTHPAGDQDEDRA